VETDTKRELVTAEPASGSNDAKAKKTFVTPEISAAVDVLEATTFFQVATSGATN
jgi:hypothetical protein